MIWKHESRRSVWTTATLCRKLDWNWDNKAKLPERESSSTPSSCHFKHKRKFIVLFPPCPTTLPFYKLVEKCLANCTLLLINEILQLWLSLKSVIRLQSSSISFCVNMNYLWDLSAFFAEFSICVFFHSFIAGRNRNLLNVSYKVRYF